MSQWSMHGARIWHSISSENGTLTTKTKKKKCKSLPNCRYATEFHFGHLCERWKKNRKLSFKSHYIECVHKYLVHLNGPFIYSENGVNSGGVTRTSPQCVTIDSDVIDFLEAVLMFAWIWNRRSHSRPVQRHCTASRWSMSRANAFIVPVVAVWMRLDVKHWAITFIETSIITWHWSRWVFHLVLQLVTGSSHDMSGFGDFNIYSILCYSFLCHSNNIHLNSH